MPTANPYPPFPALYLYPLNDSFVPKQISLAGGQHVKIGRQTNAKTVPGDRNGYFDSKVLSRQHAEVWEEGGKIFIKDVKSSNGTFVNGDRLSPEGVESEPWDLKTEDMVEFGIDIVGEDNKTIIHHKVSARVVCVFTAEEALNASREMYNYHHHQQSHQPPNGPGGTLGPTAQRRPALPQANGLTGIGGMGGGMRQPGSKGHMNFEMILQKLQSELQKSRETSMDLSNVSSAMNDIGDVLSGGQPANLPAHPPVLPPVRQPQQQQPQSQHPHPDPEPSSNALQSLQNQLAETQASLSTQVEKIRSLETLLSEHDNIRREVLALRELIDHREHHHHHSEDDDDSRSIRTIVPRELEAVPEEDELEPEESDEERNARREELGRPRTPEPSSLGMCDDDELDHDERLGLHQDTGAHLDAPPQPPGITDEAAHRLAVLSEQLESAIELSRTLQVQHSAAQQTIENLQGKVSELEDLVRSTQAAKVAEDARLAEEAAQREKEQQTNMSVLFEQFKKTIEDRWDLVKSDWEAERERMEKSRGEFDGRFKALEDGFSVASGKFEVGLSNLAAQLTNMNTNGHLPVKVKSKGGLATPPSPRSLSDAESDSDHIPIKSRRKRSRSSSRSRTRQGKSRSRSPATSASATLVDGMSTDGVDGELHSRSSSGSPSIESANHSPQKTKFSRFPPTPESSVHFDENVDAVAAQKAALQGQGVTNAQVAMGVFVLGFATAAVLWRVKE